MKTAILGLIMIILIGVLIAVRRSPVKNLLPANVETNAFGNPYHCVAIRHRDSACAAAKRLSGQRFLSKEAPRLPLPECDAAACHCRYVHFEDRRQGDERRDVAPTAQRLAGSYGGPERRFGGERRRFVPGNAGAGAMRG